jgi:hypothetical protein
MKSSSEAVRAPQTDEQWRNEMRVICTDGVAGTSKALIVDPLQRRLTHVVVRERGLVVSDRLVPKDLLNVTSEEGISLQCSRSELHEVEDFIEAHFVEPPYAMSPLIDSGYESSQLSPLVISKRVPKGEVALGRWAVVEATDGPVGHLDSLIVDPASYRITEVVVRTHHHLTRQEAAVPVGDIDRFFSNYIMLRVNRTDVEGLPHVPRHEAYLLPPLASTDQDLLPEDPQVEGVDDSQSDPPHLEGAHLLTEAVGARLRARGFTDDQILHWAKAFLRAEKSGGDAEFLAWIRQQEQASNVISRLSKTSEKRERHAPVFKESADRS